MFDLLIIANYTQAPGEDNVNRFNYIAQNMNNDHLEIEIVTSSFSHTLKKQRDVSEEQRKRARYKYTMLYEPGYKKNVSLKRIYSHFILGKRLKKYLKIRKKPDIIYCAVPSLELAKVAAKYAKKNNIKFIIDIQDLWPEAFKMVVKSHFLRKMLFYLFEKKANYIYSAANDVIAVSQTYLDRVTKVNNRSNNHFCVFLGTELMYFDKLAQENKITVKPKDEVWLGYIGTLGHSYDIKLVIDALKIIEDSGYSDRKYKFIVMGDGPLRQEFEEYGEALGEKLIFTGSLNYGEMIGMLKACDIAVNPITKGSVASIINKHCDYAAAGLPIINTQESIEYRNLVDDYEMGYNCLTSKDVANKLIVLFENPILREKMGKNSRKLAEEKFDRSHTYKNIFKLLGKHNVRGSNEFTGITFHNESK
ncbi:glycosyltransferase family 4 protein [Lysinibacillus sp. BW-2-10]|uniref:glycosyltransferase family 4 protein n=1 Tax=Lysinibacillus sp. BW-2-10 TaxID=2590030 RepID=UPI00117C6E7B|nr:glycosyltransferase family 4 protein [Lysinibacillus sp. BW-2-10]TSI11331.1 glycosyltransferase family 4 protein [Lysinibacillus sp. BW-2-10]